MYTQVCVDFKSRCVYLNMFDEYGRKVREVHSCGIELIEVSGTVRISLSEHILKDYLCISLENVEVFIDYKGSMLKISDKHYLSN